MEERQYIEGEIIKFRSPVDATVILTGKIRGIASAAMAIIGRTFIVELIGNPFPEHHYSCISVFECSIV